MVIAAFDQKTQTANPPGPKTSLPKMDLLKAEIARKRRAVELAKSSDEVWHVDASGGEGDDSDGRQPRQYLRASDLRRFQNRLAESAQGGDHVRNRRLGLGGQKRKKRDNDPSMADIEDDGAAGVGGADDAAADGVPAGANGESRVPGKSQGLGGGVESDSEAKVRSRGGANDHNKESLIPAEVTRMLRELGLPVRLFGERTVRQTKDGRGGGGYDDASRLERLRGAQERRRAAAAGASEMDEFRLGGGHGVRNTFLGGRKRGDGVDDEEGDTGGDKVANRARLDVAVVGSGAGDKIRAKAEAREAEKDIAREDEDSDDPHKRIYRFFKSLLRQWEDDLARRPESTRRTATGRNETKTVKQCKDYIRPLFRLCKKRTLEEGMTANIVRIVENCEKGEFVRANDAYLDLAIGRAAWPMGVTMVGIHARSGREKINASNVAHVMNNELQRKYLTSVKRLMSYSQKKRTDVDPSKKVLHL